MNTRRGAALFASDDGEPLVKLFSWFDGDGQRAIAWRVRR